MGKYKIADLIFELKGLSDYTERLCKDYLYLGNENPDCEIEITKNDINKEREVGEKFIKSDVSDVYFESLALYRKICSYVLNNANGMLIHSSSLAVDNKAYLFTAPSGTGKSTHAKMWREYLGDKVVMINDDKPLIREVNGMVYVYGTPWNGKHRLGNNGRYEVKAICKIVRGKEDKIKRIDKGEMLINLLKQTILPVTEGEADKYFAILTKIVESVDTYELECTISVKSAKLAYETMSKGE